MIKLLTYFRFRISGVVLNILLINDIEAIPSLSNIKLIVNISLCCVNICLSFHPLLVCFCFGVVCVRHY